MATSGSRDFDLDVADIIEEAYERCGLEVRTGYDAKTARRSLNIMFSEWANRGVNLWTVKQATLTLISGTATYTSTNGLASPMNDILEVAVRRSGTDFDIDRISRGEYLNVPNKSTTGRPSQFILIVRPALRLHCGRRQRTALISWCITTSRELKTQTHHRTPQMFRIVFCRAWLLVSHIISR